LDLVSFDSNTSSGRSLDGLFLLRIGVKKENGASPPTPGDFICEMVSPTTHEEGASMYATLRRYEGLEPAKIDELTRVVSEELRPLLAQNPGFLSYELMRSRDAWITSFGVFETKAAAQESNRTADSWIRTNAGGLLANPPTVTSGELVPH
jgi:quinol monooxygenase YgiN